MFHSRPEQLLLEDDPAFFPDLALQALDISLLDYDLSTTAPGSRASTTLSPYTAATSPLIDLVQGGPVGGLIIPSGTSDLGVGYGDLGGFISGDDGPGTSTGRQRSALWSRGAGLIAGDVDTGFLPEADFSFDDEGNMLDFATAGAGNAAAVTPAAPPTVQRRLGESEEDARSRVRREHEEARRAGTVPQDEFLNIDIPQFDNDNALPEGSAFPAADERGRSGILRCSESARPDEEEQDIEETSSTGRAPMRRRRQRAPKILPIDYTMEISSRDLKEWQSSYLANMTEAATHKLAHRQQIQAKKNAEHWILGAGLGGIGTGVGISHIPSALSIFSGAALLEALTGIPATEQQQTAGQKHPSSDAEDQDTRRVRPRLSSDGEQLGRGIDEIDIGMLDPKSIDNDNDVEFPREAPSALDDFSSAMPWNISASIRGSSVGRGRAPSLALGAGAGAPTSDTLGGGGGPGSFGRGARRGSRFVSASPLLGRSRPGALQDLPSFAEEGGAGVDAGDEEGGAGRDVRGLDAQDAFELYGPAAGIEMQSVAQSQWQRAALDAEAGNFLAFIEFGILERLGKDGGSGEEDVGFEELLPTGGHSRVVAAQGLLHVLSLVTKHLCVARQEVGFGEIRLGLVVAV